MGSELGDLTEQIREFAIERDWTRFHTPKNLAISVAIEAGELMEQFQWTDQVDSSAIDEIGSEIADVAIYLLRLADVLEIDVAQEVWRKLELNRTRSWPQQ